MSVSKKKKKGFSYQKFTVKDSTKAVAPKFKVKPDSVSRLKLLESKYRGKPIPLAPGKSKAVFQTFAPKRPGKKANRDAVSTTPTRGGFYVRKKPVALLG